MWGQSHRRKTPILRQPSGAVGVVTIGRRKRGVSALADTVPFFGIAEGNHGDKVVKRVREHKERPTGVVAD